MATSRASTVVLALHYQNETVHPEGRIRVGIAEKSKERADIIAAARLLLDGARRNGIPVISVRIAFRPDFGDVIANAEIWRRVVANKAMAEGSWGAAFYEGLGPIGDEPVVTHNRNNPFHASPLEDVVKRFGPNRLVVAGISTTYVVESAVRHASDLGYEVIVAADACSSGTRQAHEASLGAMSMLATIKTAAEVIADFERHVP
jgi:nicotinamidase-related amidase